MSKYVDFAELKSRISIEQALAWLGIELKRHGEQLRGPCPIHDGSDPRQFVVTPAKEVWYCFGDCKEGGDLIELVAKVKRCGVREAALLLEDHFTLPPSAGRLPAHGLDYLQSEHAAVQALGLSSEVAQRLGVGYAGKGTMRGRVCLPLRSADGSLIGYCGYSDELEPKLKFPLKFL